MLFNKNKYLKNISKIITIAVIVIILSFSLGLDFLHNHEADFHKHEDCPAHQIYCLLSSVTFAVFLFIIIIVFLFFLDTQVSCLNLSFHKDSYLSRAPPACHS